MDSRKFKKQNKVHKHKRNKKITLNKRYILNVLMIIIILGVIIGVIGSIINKAPDDTTLIKPEIFDFTPYGYGFNKQLYGYCNASDEYGNVRTYYFTLEQMAALYDTSDGTYNYTDGIYIRINNTTDNYNIVTDIYKNNGRKIIKSYNFDEYEFAENARFLVRNQTYCARGFGFTPEEYQKSTF